MTPEWEDFCPELEKQTPYIIANIVYAASIDPFFSEMKKPEEAFLEEHKPLFEPYEKQLKDYKDNLQNSTNNILVTTKILLLGNETDQGHDL